MSQQDLIRLSQGHLNLLSTCPPRFQQVYLNGLNSLPEPEHQESMQWGSQFHLLMQQRELGLPISSLLTTNSELELAFKALIAANPYLQPQNSDIWREAEHSRSIKQDNFLLTVIYDLLIAKPDQAIILDWKTYRQPRSLKTLRNDWQTRLYLYVLAETSEYNPEEIQMIYWFVGSGKSQKIKFDYHQKLHAQTKQDLASLLVNLTTWMNNFQQMQTSLPHKLNCQLSCPHYQRLCSSQKDDSCKDWNKLIDNIKEITI